MAAVVVIPDWACMLVQESRIRRPLTVHLAGVGPVPSRGHCAGPFCGFRQADA